MVFFRSVSSSNLILIITMNFKQELSQHSHFNHHQQQRQHPCHCLYHRRYHHHHYFHQKLRQFIASSSTSSSVPPTKLVGKEDLEIGTRDRKTTAQNSKIRFFVKWSATDPDADDTWLSSLHSFNSLQTCYTMQYYIILIDTVIDTVLLFLICLNAI